RSNTRSKRFFILRIDLLRDFDMVNPYKLLSVLEKIANKDELHLIPLFLRETNLSLRLDHHLLSPFESTIGTPQDDSLSLVLFVVYIGAVLRALSDQLDVPHDSSET
ncbi:Endonuclease Reverse transcriptase, partial [Phytophthora megakarya]